MDGGPQLQLIKVQTLRCHRVKGPAPAEAAAAAAASTAATGKNRLPQAADPSRILFIGGLPAHTVADVLEQQLDRICTHAGCKPTRVQVGAGATT